MTRDQLRERIGAGERFEYLLFWGHSSDGRIGSTCLSQWYPQPFVVDAIPYPTAEHWMMAEKARLFGDDDALALILAAEHPGDAKARGRAVRGFDQERWEARRYDIVVRGNVEKFGQCEPLKKYLIGTGDQVLVEASPRDTIWGIGLGRENPAAKDPDRWRGLNLLGFALMDARTAVSGS